MTALDVAMVVPVRDEAASIDALARSIAAQVRPPDEVVFVDGGSIDDTVDRLERWTATHRRWRVLRRGPASPGRGRNLGIEDTTATWIALADAGMVLDAHWLARLLEVARADPTAAVVFGHVEAAGERFVERCAALAYVPPPRLGGLGPVRDGSIACALLRRDAWEAVGGFPDLRAGEDGLFLRRIASAGLRTATAPEARLRWSVEPTLRGTYRRFRMYSRVNAEAGLQRDWHHGVARQWLVAIPFLVGARRWRALALVPAAGFAARTVRSVVRRREGRSLLFAAHPVRLAGVAAMLLTCDAATFVGWLDAIRDRRAARSVQG